MMLRPAAAPIPRAALHPPPDPFDGQGGAAFVVVVREYPGLFAALLQIPDHDGEGVHLPVAGLHDARPVLARGRD